MQEGNGWKWERADVVVDRQIDAANSHIWPFADSFPIDVRFLIIDRRRDVPMHRPDHFEVVFFESGELGYEVEQRSCALRKNDLIVVGNRIHHRCLRVPGSQPEPRIVVLSFRPELLRVSSAVGDDDQYLMPFTAQDSSFPNVVPAGAGVWREVAELIQRIRGELPGTSERQRLAIRTYLRMILLALVNYYWDIGEGRAALGRRRADLDRLSPVFQYLERHCEQPIRVPDAARLCAMNASRFMHLFREVTGESFVAYLNQFRVTRAKALLADTDKTIAEISHEMGFCDQSYFGVIFRRVAGMTPLGYRRNAAATRQ
jgi:AraC-like DNA-binding protein